MVTTRAVRRDVKDVLDYLIESEIALYANEVSMGATRVSWHAQDPDAAFLTTRDHATVSQYLEWVKLGSYSAILLDGSLLQISYQVASGEVSGHRLAYIPCPFILDVRLLSEGEPLADVVEVYRDSEAVRMALRSPVRFDYDPAAVKEGHPSMHMTINSADCRIACVAPMHVYRFVDFIFRSFYPALHFAHRDFFARGAHRHIGSRVIADDDRVHPHLMWEQHTVASGLAARARRPDGLADRAR